MINYYTETNFCLEHENEFLQWIETCVLSHNFLLGEINYIFVDDVYLHKMNKQFLDHDTLTDIITFDYTENNLLSADIYISIDRVKENAELFKVPFYNELSRVMIHGVLHLMGLKDKTDQEKETMRKNEDECLKKINLNNSST
jgi:rRNA maturation RNase YbeY